MGFGWCKGKEGQGSRAWVVFFLVFLISHGGEKEGGRRDDMRDAGWARPNALSCLHLIICFTLPGLGSCR